MRFLRGMGLGIMMFALWVVSSVFAAFSFMSEYGFDRDFELGLVSPLWSILMVVGFLGMFAGPLYYWIIEPMRGKGQPRQQYFTGPRSTSPVPVGQISNFCSECGTPNEKKLQFCVNCGVNLLQK